MPEKALVNTGKAGGWVAWVLTAFDWLCSIPMERWTGIFVLIGAILGVIAYAIEIKRRRLECRLTEMEIADREGRHESDS